MGRWQRGFWYFLLLVLGLYIVASGSAIWSCVRFEPLTLPVIDSVSICLPPQWSGYFEHPIAVLWTKHQVLLRILQGRKAIGYISLHCSLSDTPDQNPVDNMLQAVLWCGPTHSQMARRSWSLTLQNRQRQKACLDARWDHGEPLFGFRSEVGLSFWFLLYLWILGNVLLIFFRR